MHWAQRASLGYVGVYVIAYVLWTIIRPGGDTGRVWFSDLTLSFNVVGAGLLTVWLSTRLVGSGRRSWTLIGLGTLSWGFGQVVWTFYELVLQQETPFPSPSDFGYLGMIPLVFLGLVTLPSGKIRNEERIKIGLDALIVMLSLATVTWFAVLAPIYDKADSSWPEKLIGLAYPLGDLVLMCALVGGFARGWINRNNPVLLPLIAGIVSFIVADLGFAFLTAHNAYTSGGLIDLGWPLGFLLIAYAGVVRWSRGEMVLESGREDIGGTWRAKAALALPYLLVLMVTGLVFFSRFGVRTARWNIFIAVALLTILTVIGRQFVTLLENGVLNRQLKALSQRLEQIVDERTQRLKMLHHLASAFSRSSSSSEIVRIGLAAFREASRAQAVAFYARDDAGRLVLTGVLPHARRRAGEPPQTLTSRKRPRKYAPLGIPPEAVRSMRSPETLTSTESARGVIRLWVPATEQRKICGFVEVIAPRVEDVDHELITTIGAEFGIAFKNQRRNEELYETRARTLEMEQSFRAQEHEQAQLASLADSMAAGLVMISASHCVSYCNSQLSELMGATASRLVGCSEDELEAILISNAEDPEATAKLYASLKDSNDETWRTAKLALRTPRRRVLRCTLFPVRDSSGRSLGRGLLLSDITRESEVDQLKDEFIGIASHELRTPLTGILGFTELLRESLDTDSLERGWAERVNDEARRLSALVSDLLDASRLDSGTTELRSDSFDLGVCLEEVIERALSARPARTVQMAGNEPLAIEADQAKVVQILLNLIDNALKYSPSDQPVEVHYCLRADAVQVSIRDHGAGIPPEELERIFEKFHRLESANPSVRGTGLGLYITKQLSELLGGEIAVESAVGEGSTFTLRLPLPQSVAAAA